MSRLERFFTAENLNNAGILIWSRVCESVLMIFFERFSFGSDSLRQTAMKITSSTARPMANMAGNQNQCALVLSANRENIAPIIGPTINPNEKAIPTNAIAFPRFCWLETSVITAIQIEILPLLKPPTKRASTKSRKL